MKKTESEKINRESLEMIPDISGVRDRVLAVLLPSGSFSWMLFGFAIVFISEISCLALFYTNVISKLLFLIILACSTFMLCMFVMIVGIFLFSHRNPYMYEWKEKLGFR
ncbi:hypothetical protein [Leptospira sp. GIMC2001]|uniref:hypothetical protein n=1 Tax=Leptospira sp. GIMC2001 TaxID=1513297 RepID=UPI002349629D|nr:hypothetical protein [Leptospira sp. GIMC2001]WCL48958.1 hypothetical protein O4O04_16925 [Leptospira sp. GIMC2001]